MERLSQIKSKDLEKNELIFASDLYIILIGQSQCFNFEWSDVKTMYGSKVACKYSNKTRKLLCAITA